MPSQGIKVRGILGLAAFVALFVCVIVFAMSSVEVDVDLAWERERDFATRIEKVIVVDDAEAFYGRETAVIRMSRWKSWLMDKTPYFVVEEDAVGF